MKPNLFVRPNNIVLAWRIQHKGFRGISIKIGKRRFTQKIARLYLEKLAYAFHKDVFKKEDFNETNKKS